MSSVAFTRLTRIPLDQVRLLLDEPRNARHMPLAARFDDEATAAWVAAKDRQWAEHGYGPWAVLVDGAFAGWAGFQHEDNGADFALVLGPAYWGHGAAITRAALDRGFGELGLDEVIIALPFSRRPDRVVARFGFRPDGEVVYGGARFRQYRLTRAAWAERRSGPDAARPEG